VAACRLLGGCSTGDAKITPGFRLPAKYVIHTVGPVWRGGTNGEPELLASCYRRSIELAIENGVRTIAFPAISCGIYGYPIDAAADVAISETKRLLADGDDIDRVLFVAFGDDVRGALERSLRKG
jgi:O-acetyl-ADP-ribose deacetylase (regulator of RNase III)